MEVIIFGFWDKDEGTLGIESFANGIEDAIVEDCTCISVFMIDVVVC